MWQKRMVYLLVIGCVWANSCLGADDPSATTLHSIKGQRLAIPSKQLGFAANIEVLLPSSYQENLKRRYPVIYLLDSQWRLSTFMHSYGVLAYEKAIPESIIIGLNANSLEGKFSGDIDSFRRTYFPPPAGKAQAGQGDKLLAYLTDELLPYIDQHYRTQPDRTLVGTSLSGLFSLYVLFQQANEFQRFIISSPSVYWDDKAIFSLEEHFAKASPPSTAKVFMGVGDEELAAMVTELAEQLHKERHPKLHMRFHQSPLGHVSADIEMIARGLRFVFDEGQ